MITITHSHGRIKVEGHAGYAELGKDIVCAAISALVQAFAASVEELTTDEIKCEFGAGKALIQYGDLSERAQVLMDSFFVGCRMVADNYPDNVRLAQALTA